MTLVSAISVLLFSLGAVQDAFAEENFVKEFFSKNRSLLKKSLPDPSELDHILIPDDIIYEKPQFPVNLDFANTKIKTPKLPLPLDQLITEIGSVHDGISALDQLDLWYFDELKTDAEREDNAKIYTFNQQRLYLLTQIARLETECDQTFLELTSHKNDSAKNSQPWVAVSLQTKLDLKNAARIRYQAALRVH